MGVSAPPRQDGAMAESRRRPVQTAASPEQRSAAGVRLRYTYLKRCLDVLLAATLIIVASPLLVLISVMILLDSGWPVFYRQERVGARGDRRGGRVHWEERLFRILKFRTMVHDADSSRAHVQFIEQFVAGELAPEAQSDAGFKLRDDPRVTRVGRFLRATSLDELPQLLNVLWGTMSLVGPRPVPPYEVALYEPWHRQRLAAVPGITGLWQVDGRGRVSFEEMVKLDIEYLRRRSLWLDLSLLVRTLPAVFSKRGAR